VALTKAEVNERYYNTVSGKIVFRTEGQQFLHPLAVAKLLAAQARTREKRALKIVELGANDCAFAMSVLKLLASLTVNGEVALDRVDYFAVELARGALQVFFDGAQQSGDFQRATPGAATGPLVGSLTRLGTPQVNVHLVHADAVAFVGGGAGGYDAVIVNELLDDLPGRAFFADEEGRRRELDAHAEETGGTWKVTVTATETAEPSLADMPPATLTATSAENLAVVRGAAAQLDSGGMLIVHDYGFTERYTPLVDYEGKLPALPEYVELAFPPGRFPRTFFRVFGNDEERVVQVTSDVAFGELVEALAPGGRVIVLPHGNAMLARREPDDLRKGDGIFLSEFALLEPADYLDAVLERLEGEQEELRQRYFDEYLDGRRTVFSNLLFVKD
jgi:hypothetical protein